MTAEHDAIPFRTRTVLHLHVGDAEDTTITVDHVYLAEGEAGVCQHEDCGNSAHDPGMISLLVADDDSEASALLDPGQALILAERLQRAAALVLEAGEDAADIEREAARYAPVESEPEAGAA
jgi:hypothetical protein